MIYLDYNATAPIRPEVFDAMKPYLVEEWGNPSSTYAFGSKLKAVIEEARGHLATLIGAATRDIVFTGSATESNNSALNAALKAQSQKKHIITSQVEHSAILNHVAALEASGYRVTKLGVNEEGLIDLGELNDAINDDTAMVSLMWANNETGVLFPVEEIGRLCRQRNVLFHCDAVQAVGKIAVDLKSQPIDYLSLSAHKIGGPKGVGALFVRKNVPFTPFIYGGHQERGRRGGTENVASLVGFGRAAQLARAEIEGYSKLVRPLRDKLETSVITQIAQAEINGHLIDRLANTSNITFFGVESEAILLLLDQKGICASAGSACLADSDEPSHVVRAMKPNSGASRQMVRFSLGAHSTLNEIELTVRALKEIISNLRR